MVYKELATTEIRSDLQIGCDLLVYNLETFTGEQSKSFKNGYQTFNWHLKRVRVSRFSHLFLKIFSPFDSIPYMLTIEWFLSTIIKGMVIKERNASWIFFNNLNTLKIECTREVLNLCDF